MSVLGLFQHGYTVCANQIRRFNRGMQCALVQSGPFSTSFFLPFVYSWSLHLFWLLGPCKLWSPCGPECAKFSWANGSAILNLLNFSEIKVWWENVYFPQDRDSGIWSTQMLDFIAQFVDFVIHNEPASTHMCSFSWDTGLLLHTCKCHLQHPG